MADEQNKKHSCCCCEDEEARDATNEASKDIETISCEDDANNDSCCCSKKTTERSKEEYTRLINRLSRIEGQIRGLKKMLEDGAYCNDILIQSSAATSALNSFNKDLLSSHIHHCVVRDIKLGKTEVVDELMDTIQRLMK